MNSRTVVLVVEDMDDEREFARSVLVRSGYLVLGARNAELALDFMRVVVIDILFTDIVLPGGMNGFQLARLARAINPAIKIVCTTGFRWALDERPDAGGAMLAKPYEPAQLVAEIARAAAS